MEPWPCNLSPVPYGYWVETLRQMAGWKMNNLCANLDVMSIIHLPVRAVLIVVCGFLSGCWQWECDPPVPALLRNLHATGGWWSQGCPPPEDFLRHSLKERVSPELTRRLRARFPPESDGAAMERYLLAEGFQISSPCGERAPSVRQAQFHQDGCPYPMNVKIAWERAEDGKLAWIKGSVSYKYP